MVTPVTSILKWSAYFIAHKLKPERPEIIEHFYNVNPVLNDKVSVWQGDITKVECDCIVNAANPTLLGGGGVDGAIHAAAGPDLLEECKELGGCAVGQAKITKGYRLPAKYIIHTVGTMKQDAVELAESYRNSLHLVLHHSLRSIVFPAISTGIYGYAVDQAAHVALRETRSFLEEYGDNVERVVFCVFSDEDLKVYEELMQRYFPIVKPEGATPEDYMKTIEKLPTEDREKCEQMLQTGGSENVKVVGKIDELLSSVTSGTTASCDSPPLTDSCPAQKNPVLKTENKL